MLLSSDVERTARSLRQSMTGRKRLSICYAAPGQNLLPTAGPTRNVLSVAEALSEWADVTVAFRNVPVGVNPGTYRAIAIEPDAPMLGHATDDTATRGFHPLRHIAYCRRLLAFARQNSGSYDVVLEKGWRLSGFLSAAFHRAGVPTALVENAVGLWLDPVDDLREVGKYLLHRAAVAVTDSCCRRIPVVIAETEELKASLVTHRGVSPDRIRVVGLGVDHRRFHPMGQQRAREALGISPDATVLLYVGGVDEYHDLEPVIDALGLANDVAAELHVVGDGAFRAGAEARGVSAGIRSRFYGHVPHDAVPKFIAAADLCLAPYRLRAFHGNVVTFATLKIPEYMACARPVVSVPSPAIARLIRDGINGFIVPNDVSAWLDLLRRLPSRAQLAAMGEAASEVVAPITWDATARDYLNVCQELVARTPRPVVS